MNFLIDLVSCIFLIVSLKQASNIIFVDQPTGTGFSYSSDQRDIRHDEVGVSNDLYDFLQVRTWYKLAFISCLDSNQSTTIIVCS